MKHLFLALFCGILFISCGGSSESDNIEPHEGDSTTHNEDATGYQPFPSGYGYLQDTDALKKAVDSADMAYIRDHAWKLWAGIMQPAEGMDWPVWYTWQNTYGAFAPGVTMDDVKLNPNNTQSLIQQNLSHLKGAPILDTLNKSLPYYPIPQPVIDEFKSDSVFNSTYSSINIGKHFMFNGDIMIPTESLSQEAFDWIRNDTLYMQSELNKLHNEGVHELDAPKEHIVTKHMYWPIPADGISAIPVWDENYYPEDYRAYAGYETWSRLVGVDPGGAQVGETANVSYLYNVFLSNIDTTTPYPTQTADAMVYGLDDFYHHKVTQEDWDSFDAADKAILNASSYWAHNKPFGVGDYIVTIAMHVNTKEVPTWALQSVWWSDTPDEGKYAENRPELPQAVGPWYHYLMVDAYGIIDESTGELPAAYNPYIELVIHPIATNCNNCHSRAGWPDAQYQDMDCPNLLEKLTPKTACLTKYTLTDFQWIIPGHARKN